MNKSFFDRSTTLIYFLLCFTVYGSAQDAVCGDASWSTFKDEKCIKLIDQLVYHQDAVQLCQQATDHADDSLPLITINSADELEFVKTLVYDDLGVVDNIWLGAERSDYNDTSFVWSDGSPLKFTNWAPDHPSSDLEKNCTQLTASLSKNGKTTFNKAQPDDGLWIDVSCGRRNLVLCQKRQTWPIQQLQKEFLQLREEFVLVQNNPVPIGFLYTELPGQPAPQTIWPSLTWTDVSSSFAGLFFRTVGGESAGFGSIQSASSPRLSKVNSLADTEGAYGETVITPGSYSRSIQTSYHTPEGSHEMALQFFIDNVETRPRNMAVRIWKRTA